VQDINVFLRGWVGYFRYGNSAQRFDKIRQYTMTRLAIFVGKRHKRSRGYGWSTLGYLSPNQYGLIRLSRTIVAPRAFRDWRARPNAGGERRR
jgi:RNA-directed DNA polymerase